MNLSVYYKKIIKLMPAGTAFVFAKSAVFIAPLLLANVLSLEAYGNLEGALAYAAMIAVILNFGVGSAIPQYRIKENKHEQIIHVYLHVGIVVSFLLLATLILFIHKYWFGALLALLIIHTSFQRIMNVEYATNSMPSKASLSSSYIFMLLIISGLILDSYPQDIELKLIANVLFFGTVLLLIWLGVRIRQHSGPLHFENQLSLYRFSGPNLLFGLLALLQTSLIRLVGIPLFGAEEFANYAFFFRLAAVSMLVSQFSTIILFKKIYSSTAVVVDVIYVRILALVLITNFLSYALIPPLFSDFLIILSGYESFTQMDIYSTISFFVLFWISISMTELLIIREKIVFPALLIDSVLIGTFIMIGVVAKYLYGYEITMVQLAAGHCCLAAVIAITHCELLRRKGTYLKSFYGVNIVMTIITLIFLSSLL